MSISKSSFTLNSDGLLRALITPCWISQGFDPANPSDRPIVKEYNAIWDTGATGSVISERVINELGLKPIGIQQVHTASSEGAIVVNEYMINVMLPNNVGFAYIHVTEGKLNGFDMLIGMDIITRGDFAVTHRDGKTKFSFQMPSTHDIDFLSELKEEQNKIAHTPITKSSAPPRNAPCPCGSGKKYKHCCGKGK